jgi:hypothetical protein
VQAVIAAFTVAILCRVLGIATTNMVVVRPAMSALLYAVPLGAAVLAAIAVQWHLYPRPPSRLARVFDGAGTLLAALWPRRPLPRAARGIGG